MKNNSSFEDVNELRRDFLDAYLEYWYEHAFLTWQWWVLLILTLLFWILWYKFVDKKRIHLVLNFGLIIGIIAFIFDMVGINHMAWGYPIRLYWAFIPPLLPFDLTYIPVSFMLIYQKYGHSWRKFMIGSLLVSGVFSFVAEPILTWMGIYQMYNWRHIYSFPIYTFIACVVKIVVDTLNKTQNKNQ
ncbi:CBO0543 family protein [Ammoniphilus resinae]|uniref:Permease n=1 Tax=Ammoniphilus resinae TaxID=861532 RepID=A0ABS4GIN3_9BACL|nr:CBO0543 family protein [Ammoniphilus resinae]MBP1930110.1 hypothetical protein [Ammoniphilus resinae]